MSLLCRDSASLSSVIASNCRRASSARCLHPWPVPCVARKWRSPVARVLSPLLVVITCLFGATSAGPSTPRDELHRHIEELLKTVDDPQSHGCTARGARPHDRPNNVRLFRH